MESNEDSVVPPPEAPYLPDIDVMAHEDAFSPVPFAVINICFPKGWSLRLGAESILGRRRRWVSTSAWQASHSLCEILKLSNLVYLV